MTKTSHQTPPRVFILTSSLRFDLGPAKEWGELVVLLNPIDLPAPHSVQRLVDILPLILREKDFGVNDYFAITGPNLQLSVALAVMAKQYEHFKVLIYDPHSRSYAQRSLNFTELGQKGL